MLIFSFIFIMISNLLGQNISNLKYKYNNCQFEFINFIYDKVLVKEIIKYKIVNFQNNDSILNAEYFLIKLENNKIYNIIDVSNNYSNIELFLNAKYNEGICSFYIKNNTLPKCFNFNSFFDLNKEININYPIIFVNLFYDCE